MFSSVFWLVLSYGLGSFSLGLDLGLGFLSCIISCPSYLDFVLVTCLSVTWVFATWALAFGFGIGLVAGLVLVSFVFWPLVFGLLIWSRYIPEVLRFR